MCTSTTTTMRPLPLPPARPHITAPSPPPELHCHRSALSAVVLFACYQQASPSSSCQVPRARFRHASFTSRTSLTPTASSEYTPAAHSPTTHSSVDAPVEIPCKHTSIKLYRHPS
jgi:hypothetical protein